MLGLTETDSMEACGKVSHICHKISEDISHLFKVSALIGKSIARDRYARAETASKEKFDGQYDVAHVKAKFRQQNAPDWLLVRLGEAITKRRQYIKYVREHRSRIDNDSQQRKEPDLPPVASPVDPSQVQEPQKAITLASRPSQMPTMATTVMSNALVNIEQTFEDNRSVTTVNTTWFDENHDQKLSVPLLTDYTTFGQEFACPFCPITAKFNSQSSWK
jgi:aspartate-semialdehyde dehydrogenase